MDHSVTNQGVSLYLLTKLIKYGIDGLCEHCDSYVADNPIHILFSLYIRYMCGYGLGGWGSNPTGCNG